MKEAAKTIVGLLILILLATVPAGAQGLEDAGVKADKKGKEAVLKEITVTGTPYISPATPVDTQYGTRYNIVTEEQIRQQNSHDFPSTLRDVPGVMTQSKNLIGSQTSHSMYIRGRGASHPSADIIIQFDGVPRYGGLFGQILGDGISVSTIGGIEVFKSPQPARFGSGYAMVNILPRHTKKEGLEGTLNFRGGSYSTFDESLSAGMKQGPFDIYVSQSQLTTDGHRPNSAASQQSYYVNSGYRLSGEWNVRALVNYVKGGTKAPMPVVAPQAPLVSGVGANGISWPGADRYETDTLFATLTLNHEYEQTSGFIKAYWNDTTFDILQELIQNTGKPYGNGTGGLWSRQRISMYGVRAAEKLNPWPGLEILAGVDVDMTVLKNTQQTYTGLAPTGAGSGGVNGGRARRVWDFPDTKLFSPYVAVSQAFGNPQGFHITPSAGGRHYSQNEFENRSAGQAGIVMGYGNTDLAVNYSRGVNYPSPVVMMNMVATHAPVDNPRNIKPEVVDHCEISLTHSWPGIATLGAAAFSDKGRDRFQAYMFGAVPTAFNDYIGHYEIRGLELTGTATPVKDLEIFAGATWLVTETTGGDGMKSNHMPYTPGFQFQAGIKYCFLNNFRLFADMQHLGNLYQGTAIRSGTFNLPQLTAKDKLGDITLVNCRLGYQFDYKPLHMEDSEVFFAINNIFNQDYAYTKGYPMAGTTILAGVSLKFQ